MNTPCSHGICVIQFDNLEFAYFFAISMIVNTIFSTNTASVIRELITNALKNFSRLQRLSPKNTPAGRRTLCIPSPSFISGTKFPRKLINKSTLTIVAMIRTIKDTIRSSFTQPLSLVKFRFLERFSYSSFIFEQFCGNNPQ